MTRDDALLLADRILALINAQPRTPSREEIADVIEIGRDVQLTDQMNDLRGMLAHSAILGTIATLKAPGPNGIRGIPGWSTGVTVDTMQHLVDQEEYSKAYREEIQRARQEAKEKRDYEELNAICDSIKKRIIEVGDRPGALFCSRVISPGGMCFCVDCTAKRDAS